MNKHKRYNIGILIGGVHTYFPKEHISGIATAAKELDINVCFFLGTQTKDFFEDMLGGTHKDSFDYQFNTIHDYSLMGGLDGLIINYGTLGLQLKNETAEKFARKFNSIPTVFSWMNQSYIIRMRNGFVRKICDLLPITGMKKWMHFISMTASL